MKKLNRIGISLFFILGIVLFIIGFFNWGYFFFSLASFMLSYVCYKEFIRHVNISINNIKKEINKLHWIIYNLKKGTSDYYYGLYLYNLKKNELKKEINSIPWKKVKK